MGVSDLESNIPGAGFPAGGPRGWVKATRGSETFDLIKRNPRAYVLAAVIGLRARYRAGFNPYNLAPGEAMLGDFESYGMTEREYRTAKKQLAEWGFATFRTTNKGTIGKLTDTRLFDPLNNSHDGQGDRPRTDQGRTKDGPETDNNKDNNGRPLSIESGFGGGLPSQQTAIAYASLVGCTPEFAELVWHKAHGRGGRDSKGAPIISWPGYLRGEWGLELQRLHREGRI